jgi:hypothetical protein
MQHPSANITVCPGTVRGVMALDNKTSIRSVLIRKLDGTEIAVNDVNLAVGGYPFLVLGIRGLTSFRRLHRKNASRDEVARNRRILPPRELARVLQAQYPLCYLVLHRFSRARIQASHPRIRTQLGMRIYPQPALHPRPVRNCSPENRQQHK